MYTKADIYRLAALASVDYRTAQRAIDGEHVKGLAGDRLRAALASFAPTEAPRSHIVPLALSAVNKPRA